MQHRIIAIGRSTSSRPCLAPRSSANLDLTAPRRTICESFESRECATRVLACHVSDTADTVSRPSPRPVQRSTLNNRQMHFWPLGDPDVSRSSLQGPVQPTYQTLSNKQSNNKPTMYNPTLSDPLPAPAPVTSHQHVSQMHQSEKLIDKVQSRSDHNSLFRSLAFTPARRSRLLWYRAIGYRRCGVDHLQGSWR
ncbi:hypothetical protein BJX99DRAFT_226332 [Aspergillus californicus]